MITELKEDMTGTVYVGEWGVFGLQGEWEFDGNYYEGRPYNPEGVTVSNGIMTSTHVEDDRGNINTYTFTYKRIDKNNYIYKYAVENCVKEEYIDR